MKRDRKYKYAGCDIIPVEVPENKCDGCCFERSVFGRDCTNVRKPECHNLGRKDGISLIFKLNGKPQKRKRISKTRKE